MTGVQGQPLDMLITVRLFPILVPKHRVFSNFSDYLNQLQSRLINDGTGDKGLKFY